MSRRGLQLVLVAVLGLVVWTMTGAVTVRDTALTGGGTTREQVVAHLGSATKGQAAALVRAPSDRSGSAGRAQRLGAIVAVLVGVGLALRSRSPTRRRDHAVPVWSGWFADPGRLRGPPAV
jgi:hypothetical protein